MRRVWDEDENGVYITDDSRFEQLKAGESDLWPVGFPREDVFKYNSELASKLEDLCKDGKQDWNKLDPF